MHWNPALINLLRAYLLVRLPSSWMAPAVAWLLPEASPLCPLGFLCELWLQIICGHCIIFCVGVWRWHDSIQMPLINCDVRKLLCLCVCLLKVFEMVPAGLELTVELRMTLNS